MFLAYKVLKKLKLSQHVKFTRFKWHKFAKKLSQNKLEFFDQVTCMYCRNSIIRF